MALKDDAWRHELVRYAARIVIPVRYGDMDANAHLNNVAIARLFEEARLRFHAFLRAKGAGVDPGGVLLAHVEIDYVAEGSYPEDVEAGVAVVKVGARSYRLAIGLFQSGRIIALADCVMVHRGTGVSDALRSALMAHAHG
ncbi:MAG: acyl-CoA thioesterase [Thermaurantiacus sp.]